MLEYRVTAWRIDSQGTEGAAKAARLVRDTVETDQRLELLHLKLNKY